MNDFTLVWGVDKKYFPQLFVTLPVWKKLFFEHTALPLLIWYDGATPELKGMIENLCESLGIGGVDIRCWMPPLANQYEDQRDKMLTGWVYLPPNAVKTKYWLKIDSDAYPVDALTEFPNPRWFEGNPVIVGHKWNYTKQRGKQTRDWFDTLDEWGNTTTLMHHKLPLGLRFPVGSNKVAHERIASYAAFFETDWSQILSSECHARCDGLFTIPIPSQDTFTWYVAKRQEKLIRRVNMKRAKITNQSSYARLVEACEELLV